MSDHSPVEDRNWRLLKLLLVLVAVVAIATGTTLTIFHYLPPTTSSPASPGPVLHMKNVSHVFSAPDGEMLGLSDGIFAFDTTHLAGDSKGQAAKALQKGDAKTAASLWQAVLNKDTTDAETLIYQENQHILDTGRHYFTVVVGTILTGTYYTVGRDNLQGAYVAQKEFNDQCLNTPDCLPVRLLIANAGSGRSPSEQVAYISLIMEQIVQAHTQDATIVGVMGWPASVDSLYVKATLAAAHIPLVSPAAFLPTTALQQPQYTFSVAPSNTLQGQIDAQYAEQVLKAHRAALFVNPVDRYSQSLADAFRQRFQVDGNSIVTEQDYKEGFPQSVEDGVQKALNEKPDMIFFAGHSSDILPLLQSLPACLPSAACLGVVGGEALYELGGYSPSVRDKLYRLHFTAFAYPDEWDILAGAEKKPDFFSEYPQDFNPRGEDHQSSPYGFTRADNTTILAYDAMITLLRAGNIADNAQVSGFSSDQLQQALARISGSQSRQGISGEISFGADGNPVNKLLVVLYFDRQNFIHLDQSFGCFLKSTTSLNCH